MRTTPCTFDFPGGGGGGESTVLKEPDGSEMFKTKGTVVIAKFFSLGHGTAAV